MALWPMVSYVSMNRFQSLAMLKIKFRLPERCAEHPYTLTSYPLQDHHMWFLRNAGLYHYLACDVPCLFIAIALLQSTSSIDPESPAVCSEHTFGDNTLGTATALLWCKVTLLLWSTFSTLTQLVLTGQLVTREIETGGDHSSDIVMKSALSIMVARPKFIDEWRRKNTRDWVVSHPHADTRSMSTGLLGVSLEYGSE